MVHSACPRSVTLLDPRPMKSMFFFALLSNWLFAMGISVLGAEVRAANPPSEDGKEATATDRAINSGREFLVRLLDPEFQLLPEFRGHHVYWLYHDNYLAAKVLSRSNPELSNQILTAIKRYGVRKSGKVEILFGEAERPLPFRSFQLVDVKRQQGKLIRTERVTERRMSGWKAYADLLFFAAIAERDLALANQHFTTGIAMWDGKGISDAATRAHGIYPTYKLALAILAAQRLGPKASKQIPDALVTQLKAMQVKQGNDAGGWITDYKRNGKPIGKANVETSCLAIMALECLGDGVPREP